MKLYRSRRIVRAEQFNPDRRPWPPFVEACGRDPDDPYSTGYRCAATGGYEPIGPGEWVVVDHSGRIGVRSDALFRLNYEEVKR